MRPQVVRRRVALSEIHGENVPVLALQQPARPLGLACDPPFEGTGEPVDPAGRVGVKLVHIVEGRGAKPLHRLVVERTRPHEGAIRFERHRRIPAAHEDPMLELFGRPGRRKAQTRAPKPEAIELPEHRRHLARRPRGEPDLVPLTRREIENPMTSWVHPGEKGGPVGQAWPAAAPTRARQTRRAPSGREVGEALAARTLGRGRDRTHPDPHQPPSHPARKAWHRQTPPRTGGSQPVGEPGAIRRQARTGARSWRGYYSRPGSSGVPGPVPPKMSAAAARRTPQESSGRRRRSLRPRYAPAPASPAAHHEDPVPVVVAAVRAGVVFRDNEATAPNRSDRAQLQVVEVDHQVGREASGLAVVFFGDSHGRRDSLPPSSDAFSSSARSRSRTVRTSVGAMTPWGSRPATFRKTRA